MYNLNVNVSAAGTAVNNLLAVESACTTPRTPEILNSLIAMTNPLDGYSFGGEAAKGNGSGNGGCTSSYSLHHDSDSSSSKEADSPTTNSPPSVQHTCSQLIKAGLKLSIESKRKHSADHDDFLDLDNIKRIKRSDDDDDGDRSQSPNHGLTPEDEERRRRRRERNKIAATKCRLKKREKTVNLVQESEVLETQNIDLKSQIQELESQRRRLVDMLTMHTPSCLKSTNQSDHYTQPTDGRYIVNDDDNPSYSPDGPLPPVTSLATSVIETNHGYNRPSSVDIGTTFRNQNIEYCNRPTSVGIGNDNSYTRSTIQYTKPPAIIVEEENYSPPSQLTNLDNTGIYHYNSQQCHNYNSSNGGNQNYNSPTMDNGCMA